MNWTDDPREPLGVLMVIVLGGVLVLLVVRVALWVAGRLF